MLGHLLKTQLSISIGAGEVIVSSILILVGAQIRLTNIGSRYFRSLDLSHHLQNKKKDEISYIHETLF
jgi:hypothetical protein